jgi:hypothetical protein
VHDLAVAGEAHVAVVVRQGRPHIHHAGESLESFPEFRNLNLFNLFLSATLFKFTSLKYTQLQNEFSYKEVNFLCKDCTVSGPKDLTLWQDLNPRCFFFGRDDNHYTTPPGGFCHPFFSTTLPIPCPDSTSRPVISHKEILDHATRTT